MQVCGGQLFYRLLDGCWLRLEMQRADKKTPNRVPFLGNVVLGVAPRSQIIIRFGIVAIGMAS